MLAKIKTFVKFWLIKIFKGIKKYQTEIILVVGVILISLLSFALGYIVAKEQEKKPLRIENSQILNTKSKLNSK